MKTEPATAAVDLAGSSAVDRRLLEELARVNAKLAALGLEPPSGYSIAPALGGDLVRVPSGTPTPSANLPTSRKDTTGDGAAS